MDPRATTGEKKKPKARATFTNKKRPDNFEYTGYSAGKVGVASSSLSSLSFRGGSFQMTAEEESKKRRIQELLQKAKTMTSPHHSQLREVDHTFDESETGGLENQEEHDTNSEQVGIRKTIHHINEVQSSRKRTNESHSEVKKPILKSASGGGNAAANYSNPAFEVKKQRDSSLQAYNKNSKSMKNSASGSNPVVKIKHLDQSEIQLQFPNSKKKLAYYKNSEGHPPKERVAGKKMMQINTNLEPSQSKQQYKLALAHAKYYKEQKTGKVNQTSISCGGITLNFSQKDEQSSKYENHQFGAKKKHAKNLQNSDPSNKDKTVESQGSQLS